MARLLLIDSDAAFGRHACTWLRLAGHHVTYMPTHPAPPIPDGRQLWDGIILSLDPNPDVALMLADEMRRQHPDLVVLLIAAPGRERDRAILARDATTLLFKPIAPATLVAQVAAHCGPDCSPMPTAPPVVPFERIQLPHLIIDPAQRRVWVGEPAQQVTLNRGEFNPLLALARHADQVLSPSSLVAAVAAIGGMPREESSVYTYVAQLRRKLGPALIETVRGCGYRLVTSPAATATPSAIAYHRERR